MRPVDAAWLAAYRVLFGVALGVSMQRFLAYGWVDELLVSPRYRFHYWGFEWVEPLSRGHMHALFWGLSALGLAMAAGLAYRVTAPLFALGLTYIQLIDVSTYLNHYYLAALLAWLFAASPAGRAYSVDAWLGQRLRRRANGPARPQVALAWLALFRTQIAVVYVFASIAKAQPDWLVHGQPLGIWLGASTDLPALGRLFTLPGVPLAMSWAGFLYDATIVLWLSMKRTRPWAFLVVLTFHTLTRALFDIGMFPVIMTASALVFFPPSWPRDMVSWVRARARLAPPAPPVAVSTPGESPARVTTVQRLALGLGLAYCVFQVAMPLRTFLYGGNVLWHEQGMRFSWRVMVRAKGGSTTFLVKSKATGKVWHVSPRRYLTPYQENEMSGQPDLILQLAHSIGEDFALREGPVEVRVEALSSLNARRGAALVDPAVDLLTVRDGLAPARWIAPSPPGPPPPIRPVL
ncbi:MAG: HTTM domain-containing protein [Myxococcales bacterium]|nr:HTTM domain-containing protein [Myxococcales bacterium]